MTVSEQTGTENLVLQRVFLSVLCSVYFISYIVFCNYKYYGALTADDGYYYFVVARNIVQHGMSSFDGHSLTNGYHPLWMVVLILQYLIVGDSIYITNAIEVALVSAALYCLLATMAERSFIFSFLFSVIFVIVIKDMVASGMEVSLWIFCFSLLALVSTSTASGKPSRAMLIGALMAATIGARVDSAVFVLPFGFLVLPRVTDKLIGFSIVAAAGIVYAGCNEAMFGIPFPVSGAVKSLGGFQINHMFLDSLTFWRSDHRLWMAPLHMWHERYWIAIILFGLAPLLVSSAPRGSVTRRLMIAYIVGFAVYTVKLVFFSSWRIWQWYDYPIIIGLTAVIHASYHLAASRRDLIPAAWERPLIAFAALILIGVTAAFFPTMPDKLGRFDFVDRMAIARFGPILKSDPIAMGDRAGTMGYFYPGSVTQLEGLVNDKEYFQALSAKGDIHALLCKRGVRYFASYAVDLGNYRDADIKVLNPFVTQFPGPSIRVLRGDEVGRVFDLTEFSEPSSGQNYLYIWRLDCPLRQNS